MSKQNAIVVTPLPVSNFLLELHSERMIDVMNALSEAGFKIVHVSGTTNRFRVEDAEEQTE
jgi:hypothetical protein